MGLNIIKREDVSEGAFLTLKSDHYVGDGELISVPIDNGSIYCKTVGCKEINTVYGDTKIRYFELKAKIERYY